MSELLPCPFCGSKNIDAKGWASTDRDGPACDDCGGTADTVELWNSRPAQQERKPVSFLEAMNIVERGFDTWKDKPHNAGWFRRIDGTPIPNDLKVNIAEAICHSTVTSTDGGG